MPAVVCGFGEGEGEKCRVWGYGQGAGGGVEEGEGEKSGGGEGAGEVEESVSGVGEEQVGRDGRAETVVIDTKKIRSAQVAHTTDYQVHNVDYLPVERDPQSALGPLFIKIVPEAPHPVTNQTLGVTLKPLLT